MVDIADSFSKYTTKEEDISGNKKYNLIWIIVLIVVVIAALYLIFSHIFSPNGNLLNSYNSMSNSSGYQAIVLNDSNLNIYFGTVKGETQNSLYLTNVFYLNVNSSSTTAKTSANPQYSLIHMTPTYSYGALDEMRINRTHILFTENLSKKSSVYKAILNYYKTHK